jgi:hypothetical protein
MVPAQHRGRTDDDEDVLPAREPSARQDPKTSISVAEARPQLSLSQYQQLSPQAEAARHIFVNQNKTANNFAPYSRPRLRSAKV